MDDFPISELHRLPYVNTPPNDGRQVLLQQSFFDHDSKEWHLYFMPRDEWIGRMGGGEPVYGSYFSRAVVDSKRDFELPISTLLTQCLSFPGVVTRLAHFENDVHNCASLLEKYHIISALDARSDMTRVLIVTELEYLLTIVRSMYDLLHDVLKQIVPKLIRMDNGAAAVKNTLPHTFADVVLKKDAIVPAQDLVTRRGLPVWLANWYATEAHAFRLLRNVRNGIVHRGRNLPEVYDLPDLGLAVSKEAELWSDLAVWNDIEPVNKRLVPLRAAVAGIIQHTIATSTRLAQVVRSNVTLPPAIGDDIHVFLRSAATHRLVEIPEMLNRPWERSKG